MTSVGTQYPVSESSRRVAVLGLVLCLGLAAACSPAVKRIVSEPEVVGVVSEVRAVEHAETIGQLLVEAPGDKTSDKYVVAVRSDTLIFEKLEEDYLRLGFETLRAGHRVQLWFTGAVRESYPAQATARQVVIVDHVVWPQATDTLRPSPTVPTPTATPTASPKPTDKERPSPTSTATVTGPSPSPTLEPSAYLDVVQEGGRLGRMWNLADVRYAIHEDRIRVVVEMVESGDHVPRFEVVEVDNEESPFPSGHDPSWGAARIDLLISDLYAYDSPAYEALPFEPQDHPRLTRIGRFPTYADSILGFSIGLKAVSAYEVHELTDPVRIVIDVLW
jgi:hypothetical protein